MPHLSTGEIGLGQQSGAKAQGVGMNLRDKADHSLGTQWSWDHIKPQCSNQRHKFHSKKEGLYIDEYKNCIINKLNKKTIK